LAGATDPNKPKYGPEAKLLREEHGYLQASGAPDYWALSPYYTAQFSDSACSIATAAMVVNAARNSRSLLAHEELVTQASLLKRLRDRAWSRAVATGGDGVSLRRLRDLLEKSLRLYGFSTARVTVHPVQDASEPELTSLRQALAANEVSAEDLIVANFSQGVFTGDADVGHFAPVGAYDAKADRVLLFDPDRRWYEPYWVSTRTFLRGMATKDLAAGPKSATPRGYILIEFGANANGAKPSAESAGSL
jgi:hypothetical protein